MKEKSTKRRPRIKSSRLAMAFKRVERRFLVSWIRFSHLHHDSHVLPFVLFFVLFIDGFVVVVPSTFCLIVAITISPERWALFGFLFAFASAANNTVTYIVGRLLPTEKILSIIEYFNMQHMWQIATEWLQDYGPLATFLGAIISLPTQMMTALIGIADSNNLSQDNFVSSSIIQAIIFVFIGHGLKSILIAALTRYGWIKLEKRFGKEAD